MLFFHIILLIALVQINAWKTTGPEVEVINSIENGRHVITQIIRPVHGEEIVQKVIGAKVVGAKKAWKRSVEETKDVQNVQKRYSPFLQPVIVKPVKPIFIKPVKPIFIKPIKPIFIKPVNPMYVKPIHY